MMNTYERLKMLAKQMVASKSEKEVIKEAAKFDWSLFIKGKDDRIAHRDEMIKKIQAMMLAAGEDLGFHKDYECVILMRSRKSGESMLKIEASDIFFALLLLNRFVFDEFGGVEVYKTVVQEAMSIDQETMTYGCFPNQSIKDVMQEIENKILGRKQNGKDDECEE